MIKWVAIEFASPKIWIKDNIKDITEAYQSARLGLQYKYKIKTYLHCSDQVLIGFVDPPENFNYGRRLRGIAKYLLDNKPEYYEQYKVGNRLFYYKEVNEDDNSTID